MVHTPGLGQDSFPVLSIQVPSSKEQWPSREYAVKISEVGFSCLFDGKSMKINFTSEISQIKRDKSETLRRIPVIGMTYLGTLRGWFEQPPCVTALLRSGHTSQIRSRNHPNQFLLEIQITLMIRFNP